MRKNQQKRMVMTKDSCRQAREDDCKKPAGKKTKEKESTSTHLPQIMINRTSTRADKIYNSWSLVSIEIIHQFHNQHETRRL